MSVKMAVAKLCACACGGAVIGGGAVHVAERPAHVQYAKVRQIKPVRHVAMHKPQPARRVRHSVTTTTCTPGTTTVFAAPAPVPYVADPPVYAGDPGGNVGGAGFPVVLGGSGGFGGGGFFGGFFGGGSGGGGSTSGNYSITSTTSSSNGATSSTTSSGGGSTSTSTGGSDPGSTSSSGGSTSTSTSGGSTSTSTSTSGGSTSTSTSTSTSSSTSSGTSSGQLPPGDPGDPTPVPAPPMILLFGAAAAALVARRQIGRRKSRD